MAKPLALKPGDVVRTQVGPEIDENPAEQFLSLRRGPKKSAPEVAKLYNDGRKFRVIGKTDPQGWVEVVGVDDPSLTGHLMTNIKGLPTVAKVEGALPPPPCAFPGPAGSRHFTACRGRGPGQAACPSGWDQTVGS